MVRVAVLLAFMACCSSAHAGLFRVDGTGTATSGDSVRNGETVRFNFFYDSSRFVPQPYTVLDPNVADLGLFEDIRDFISEVPIGIRAFGSETGRLAISPFRDATVYNDSIATSFRLGPMESYYWGNGGELTADCSTGRCLYPSYDPGYLDDFEPLNWVFVAALNGDIQTYGTPLRPQPIADFTTRAGGNIGLSSVEWNIRSVPEPAPLALLGLGLALATLRRRY